MQGSQFVVFIMVWHWVIYIKLLNAIKYMTRAPRGNIGFVVNYELTLLVDRVTMS